ncbi:hypothetical protein B0H21DRAFT_708507 [Amylocystis lapponica]|nr:hypothetical protein B0H21DRAFT_708507 [Amylocystis lapponica]
MPVAAVARDIHHVSYDSTTRVRLGSPNPNSNDPARGASELDGRAELQKSTPSTLRPHQNRDAEIFPRVRTLRGHLPRRRLPQSESNLKDCHWPQNARSCQYRCATIPKTYYGGTSAYHKIKRVMGGCRSALHIWGDWPRSKTTHNYYGRTDVHVRVTGTPSIGVIADIEWLLLCDQNRSETAVQRSAIVQMATRWLEAAKAR